VGDALADGRLVEHLEDDARARFPRLAHDGARVDHSSAQRQVRIAGVGGSAVVVEMHVHQLGVRLPQEGVKGAADGGVPGVEDEAELAEVEVAGGAEVRETHPRQVLDDDSHAELAEDLRRQIRSMLTKGQSEREILVYMTQRYGDFVLYRPPFKTSTALLWAGPAMLLALALGTLAVVLRRRQRLGNDAFEPDTDSVSDDREAAPDAKSG